MNDWFCAHPVAGLTEDVEANVDVLLDKLVTTMFAWFSGVAF